MGVYNDKHRAYTDKYVADHYDSVLIRLPRGRKSVIQDRARQQGISVNAYVTAAIERAIEDDDRNNNG